MGAILTIATTWSACGEWRNVQVEGQLSPAKEGRCHVRGSDEQKVQSGSVSNPACVPTSINATTARRWFVAMAIALGLTALTAGCASFKPKPAQEAGFMQRKQMQTQGGVTVTVAVPSLEEAAAVFDVPLHRREIQPVWIRIDNSEDVDYIFLPAEMDPNYFSPQEVAWMFRSGFSSQAKRDMQVYLDRQAMRPRAPKGHTVEGFVHTNKDYGVKHVSVVLYHPGRTKAFEFVVEVPGIQADYSQVAFDKVVPPRSRRAVSRE